MLNITEQQAHWRLDRVVRSAYPTLSRAQCLQWFKEGLIQVKTRTGSRVAKKGETLAAGSKLLLPPLPPEGALADGSVSLDIVCTTPDYVVVNKAAGIPCAPLAPAEVGTVANSLLHQFPEMQEVGYSPREPGLIHRLDVGTSGLLMAARSERAFRHLTQALTSGQFDKRYLAIVQAELPLEECRVTGGIASHPTDPRRVVQTEQSRTFTTEFRMLRKCGAHYLVEARACAAYRHQVRLHLSLLGAPLLGDTLYGGGSLAHFPWHALHASRLAWQGDSEVPGFSIEQELPTSLQALLSEALLSVP